jgi:HK97 family phage prohead protease
MRLNRSERAVFFCPTLPREINQIRITASGLRAGRFYYAQNQKEVIKMKVELRADTVELSGYVNAVERRSELLPKAKGRDAPGEFREIIRQGAFGDSLKRLPKVDFKLNHERTIGSTPDSIELEEDNIGLYACAQITDPEVVSLAKAGKLTGWSFGMENVVAEYKQASDGVYERDISRLDLFEVSILTHRPAYPATSVEVRDGRVIEYRDSALTPDELEKINSLALKELSEEEVFTFPVTLCDNEIDRDGERFSIAALNKLAELYKGVTGIFDHDPKGSNQSARIYDCEVVTDESRTTSAGEPLTQLRAKAYMVRTSSNADLIAEIAGGIKKEVSVSCSIGKKLCSVCGADLFETVCDHTKGKEYDGKCCHYTLDEPTDAYEWSFVAVPAQKGAGVTKTYSEQEQEDKNKAIIAAKRREIEILRLKGRKNYEP